MNTNSLTTEDLEAQNEKMRIALEAANELQNWLEDNTDDDLWNRIPMEPWNRISYAVAEMRNDARPQYRKK